MEAVSSQELTYTPPNTLPPYHILAIRGLVQTTSACLQTTPAVLLLACLQNVFVAHLAYALLFFSLAVLAHMYVMYAYATARASNTHTSSFSLTTPPTVAGPAEIAPRVSPPLQRCMRLRGGAPTPTAPSIVHLVLFRFAINHELRRTHPSDAQYDALLIRFRFLTSLLDALRTRTRPAALYDARRACTQPSSLLVPSVTHVVSSSPPSAPQPATTVTTIALSDVTGAVRAAHPHLDLPGSPATPELQPSDEGATLAGELAELSPAPQVGQPVDTTAAEYNSDYGSTLLGQSMDTASMASEAAPPAPAVPSEFGASTQLFEDVASTVSEEFGEEEVESGEGDAESTISNQPPPLLPALPPQPPSIPTFHSEWCERCELGRSTPPTEAGRQHMLLHRNCPRCGWDLDDDWEAEQRRAYEPDLGTGGTCLGCGATQRPYTGCLSCGAPVDPDDGSFTYYFGEWLTPAQVEQLAHPVGYGTDDDDDNHNAADDAQAPLAGDADADAADTSDDPAPAGEPGPTQW